MAHLCRITQQILCADTSAFFHGLQVCPAGQRGVVGPPSACNTGGAAKLPTKIIEPSNANSIFFTAESPLRECPTVVLWPRMSLTPGLSGVHRVFRNRKNPMTLRSAFEDLVGTTLASISGLLAKIEYLSSLRGGRPSAPYQHWGLARVYGEHAAQKALSEAHRTLFLKVLRTSLRDLHRGAGLDKEALSIPAQDYLEELRGRGSDLLPADLGGGSVRHFNSVLRALSSLAKHSPPSTPLV